MQLCQINILVDGENDKQIDRQRQMQYSYNNKEVSNFSTRVQEVCNKSQKLQWYNLQYFLLCLQINVDVDYILLKQ